jgi:hypothetical protein
VAEVEERNDEMLQMVQTRIFPVGQDERRADDAPVAQYYTLARSTTLRMIGGESFQSVAPSLLVMKDRQNAAASLLAEAVRRDHEAIRSAFVASRNTQRNTLTIMAVVRLAIEGLHESGVRMTADASFAANGEPSSSRSACRFGTVCVEQSHAE